MLLWGWPAWNGCNPGLWEPWASGRQPVLAAPWGQRVWEGRLLCAVLWWIRAPLCWLGCCGQVT